MAERLGGLILVANEGKSRRSAIAFTNILRLSWNGTKKIGPRFGHVVMSAPLRDELLFNVSSMNEQQDTAPQQNKIRYC